MLELQNDATSFLKRVEPTFLQRVCCKHVLGWILEGFGALLAVTGVAFVRSWAAPGLFWASLGHFLGTLGCLLAALWSLRAALGHPGSSRGSIFERLSKGVWVFRSIARLRHLITTSRRHRPQGLYNNSLICDPCAASRSFAERHNFVHIAFLSSL